MDQKNYLPRVIDTKIEEYLKTFEGRLRGRPQMVRQDLDFRISQQQQNLYWRPGRKFSEPQTGRDVPGFGSGW